LHDDARLDCGRGIGYLVELFNKSPASMATMNFSVPEDVKQAFNAVFQGQNKSAVLTQLLREAIARAEQQQQREAAARRILRRRAGAPVFGAEELLMARREGRP